MSCCSKKEKKKCCSSCGTGGFLLGILTGTLAGAAVASLFAPAPGSQTRQKLAKRVANLKEKLPKKADKALDEQGVIDLDNEA